VTYTVVSLLGRGGMATVELAVDGRGRYVARKRVCLSGSVRQIELARQRIRREAEILSSLHHPGILPLLAVEDDGADVVLVMPRMVGSLADRVATSGPLPPAEVITMGRVLLGGLATAHRQGVIHRDIKPANVLFDDAGRPVLADFGVAVARHFTPGLTDFGTVVGTPEYLAPEQAKGAPATPASDVFSLGATLGYALTGQGPYGRGEPMVVMAQAARGQVRPLPRDVPAELRRPLAAMLDPRPGRRPSAAAALGGPTGTQVQPAAGRNRSPSRRWGKVAAVLAGAGVVALAALVIGLALRSLPRSSSPIGSATGHVPSTPPCSPLPYQPCGGLPAPFTDGRACLDGHADYDGIAANGCEAVSTFVPGTVLSVNHAVLANLVPADTVDTFRTYVKDNLLNFCTGEVQVTLTAPPGVADQVEVALGDHVLERTVSRGGEPATAKVGEPSCFSDNSTWLTIRVSAVDGRTATNFRLVRTGSW
jgi:tRNA A-37 threonylcarbamoyl transferase component Bud32